MAYNGGVMEHIKAHIKERTGKVDRATRLAKTEPRRTERGELMHYFLLTLNRARVRDGIPPLTMPRMGRILEAIPTKDLYYLKSVCDQASNFSKKFWWEINPAKHALQPTPPAPPKRKVSKRAPRTRG